MVWVKIDFLYKLGFCKKKHFSHDFGMFASP